METHCVVVKGLQQQKEVGADPEPFTCRLWVPTRTSSFQKLLCHHLTVGSGIRTLTGCLWGLSEMSIHCPHRTGCMVGLNEHWFPSFMARRHFWWWEAHRPLCSWVPVRTQRTLTAPTREVAGSSRGHSAMPRDLQPNQASSTRQVLFSGILALALFSCIHALNAD